MNLGRRTVLLGLSATMTLGHSSLALAQASKRKRFVVIILRGAMDGLATIAPYGDPNLHKWRAFLTMPEPQKPNGLLDLGGFWGLHPSMPQLHALYRAGEALPVQAIAGPTRSRSHFEAQDLLECGAEQRITSGWLNRLASILPTGGSADNAIALSQNIPLVLRGPAKVATWTLGSRASPAADFYRQLQALHDTDPLTGPVLADGLREREFNALALSGLSGAGPEPEFVSLARAAGRLLADSHGPRLAELDRHCGARNDRIRPHGPRQRNRGIGSWHCLGRARTRRADQWRTRSSELAWPGRKSTVRKSRPQSDGRSTRSRQRHIDRAFRIGIRCIADNISGQHGY